MYSLFIGLALFASVMLVLVVLAQNSKGGGLSNQFGGSGASSLIGVKKTGDLLGAPDVGLCYCHYGLYAGHKLYQSNERTRYRRTYRKSERTAGGAGPAGTEPQEARVIRSGDNPEAGG